jgi:hypothetical protein
MIELMKDVRPKKAGIISCSVRKRKICKIISTGKHSREFGAV